MSDEDQLTGEKLYKQRYRGKFSRRIVEYRGLDDPPALTKCEMMLWDELADAKADRDRLQISIEALSSAIHRIKK